MVTLVFVVFMATKFIIIKLYATTSGAMYVQLFTCGNLHIKMIWTVLGYWMRKIGTGLCIAGNYATERVESNLVGEHSGLLSYRTLEIETGTGA
ncbi:hypothetical protein [Neobacillus citreus]|uniref:Uncharacterized protein n=1 Tax=Neobacillus citreus TaxID=2833578 RepID=A0A9J6MVK8_9BACI|nr:hypothetical protein [Neobacillus citreus]MCH6265491.1 hypothetical protein [Neobacillus citreus]